LEKPAGLFDNLLNISIFSKIMSKNLRPRMLPVLLLLSISANIFAQKNYFPTAENWETRTPEQARFDPVKLKAAIDFAVGSEAKAPRSLELAHYQTFGREPFGEAVGPFKERGEMTGIIIRNGYIVAEWGDVNRVDMTFSVTKSFLSTVVGLAFDRKLIRSLQDPAAQ
jgi:CubicO group peptidase (beta-lactamase class C family)